ncbi:MAG: SDR family oxidoreductase [Actinomycetota bacterium]|nr:SDR family oxidoreductase [Actinomycetota bacterium]
MRVLVTGHEGYIGQVLVEVLANAGHEVHGLDSALFINCTHGPPRPPITAAEVDIRDVTRRDLDGFDAVVHLAALSNDPLGDIEPFLTDEINRWASVRLASLAKEAGVRRFLYSSSCSVYGAGNTDVLLDEAAPMLPVTPYARSKVQVEEDLLALASATFAPVCLRNATVYGWSPRLRLDLVLNDLVASAYLEGVVRVLSDGTPWRPLVHVEDVARAFLAVLEAPADAVRGEAFNVGDEAGNRQVQDIAEAVAEVVPGSEVVITGERGSDSRTYRVDFSKLRKHVPSFRCTWTVHDGAAQLHEAFRRVGLTHEDHARTFRRVEWLNGLRAAGRVDDTLRPRRPETAGVIA